MSEDETPPEMQLIEDRRKSIRPALSVRKAAAAAGISEGRWRALAKGVHQVSRGNAIPTRAPADTLARMAKVVGATPDQLRDAERDDAADELQNMDGEAPTDVGQPSRSSATNWPDLSTEGGRINKESLTSLIVDYMAARDRPAHERAHLMAKAIRRSIHSVRLILLRDEERNLRANAIDALNPADAALTFLEEALTELQQESPHADQPESTPGSPPATQSGAQAEDAAPGPPKKIRAADGRVDNKPEDLTPPNQGDSPDDYELAGRDVGGISEAEHIRRKQDEAERGEE